VITETDWEVGLPPPYVDVEVFIYGQVRRGRIADGFFRFSDTYPAMRGGHPLGNMVGDVDRIEAWRYVAAEPVPMMMLSLGSCIELLACFGFR